MKEPPRKPCNRQLLLSLDCRVQPSLTGANVKEEAIRALADLLLDAVREPRSHQMNPKLKPEHLSRTAVVYVRQSSIGPRSRLTSGFKASKTPPMSRPSCP